MQRGVGLLFRVCLACAAFTFLSTTAEAGPILLGTGPGHLAIHDTGGLPENSFAQAIPVATNTTLTGWEMYFGIPTGGDARFWILDGLTSTVLYSELVPVAPSAAVDLVLDTLATPFQMLAGSTYGFVVGTNRGWDLGVFPALGLDQNGLTLGQAYSFTATLNAVGPCVGCSQTTTRAAIELQGYQDLQPVPEPGTLVFVGTGLAAGIWRRWRAQL